MKTDQPNREDRRGPHEAGRGGDSTRNAEPRPVDRDPTKPERRPQDDLVLHDDDEAELDLPR